MTIHAHGRLALLLLLAALGACGERAAEGSDLLDEQVPEAARFGGTAVIGIAADVNDVNPLTLQFTSGRFMQVHLLFMPLVGYDAQLQPVPRVARSWELDEEAGTLTFHLRDDVHWHDGVRTTAHDMQFAYERARDPRTAYPFLANLDPYGDAVVVDSFTWRVRITPHAEYLAAWHVLPPLPRHLLEAVPPQELARHPFSTHAPVGNGPFRFVERLPGQRWVFEANPDFAAELGGRPYLDRVVFRVIPEPTTLLTELLTGGIDFYYQVRAEQTPRISASRDARVTSAPGIMWLYLGFNQRRPPFDDPRVRRALTLAIDRQQILDAVLAGYGSVANSTISPFRRQHDPSAGAELVHDPERARSLLAEAGFTERGADGVLRGPTGTPFRFTILIPQGYQDRNDAGQMIQADLRRIGIDARLQTVEFNTLVAQITNRRRDFDATIMGFNTGIRPDDVPIFACRSRDLPFAFLGYCSPETDALLDSVLAMPDLEAARPLWSRYQHRLAGELPMTFLLFPDELHAASTRLRGITPDARGAWVGIERWWLDSARR
jgi:peptide/nickel transport system substrate-binding protein